MRMRIPGQWEAVSSFIGTLVALAAIAAAVLASPWFSWTENALSDLGNYGNGFPAAVIFNAGMFAAGALMLPFSAKLRKASRPGAAGFAVTSLALSCVGLFPETAGRMHFAFSVLFFVSLLFTMLVLGSGWLAGKGTRRLGAFSLLLPVVPLLVWTMPFGGVAIPEFVSSAAGIFWLYVVCWHAIHPHDPERFVKKIGGSPEDSNSGRFYL